MLRKIATACSECTTKRANKVSSYSKYIVSGLIDFYDNDLKREQKTDWKKMFVFVKNNVLTKN